MEIKINQKLFVGIPRNSKKEGGSFPESILRLR